MKKIRWIVVLLVGVLFILYGRFEYTQIEITEIEMKSPLIGDAFNGKKIVFLTDFQYDHGVFDLRYFDHQLMSKVINLVEKEKPDLVLLGGDFANDGKYIQTVVNYLEQLDVPLGIYTVIGNHDYLNKEDFYKAINGSNIEIIRNGMVEIKIDDHVLQVVGVEDYRTMYPSIRSFENQISDKFTMLLTHNPDFYESLSSDQRGKFDIALAGHTHGGLINFFGLYAPYSSSIYNQKYLSGWVTSGGGNLYVSKGLGGGIGPLGIRIFAQPEIVVIHLKSQ